MKEQLIACLRTLADGIEAGTTRVHRFSQEGNITSLGELYEGSLELYFSLDVQGTSDDEDDFYFEDGDDGTNAFVTDTLNKLLEKREVINGEY